MSSTPLVSIIIPVYCVEAYIEQCLLSAMSQTYTSIEIICIDDGSPDASVAIAKDVSQHDARVLIHSQENQGLSGARNTGVSLSSGEYVFFLDSDDWLVPEAIETLVNVALTEKAIIVSGGVISYDEESESTSIYKKNRVLGDITLNSKNFFCLPIVTWNKLYHYSVVKSNPFTVGIIHEDEDFYWRVFAQNRRVYSIKDDVIYYRRRAESITTQKNYTDAYQDNYITIIENASKTLNESKDLSILFKKFALKFMRKMKKRNISYMKYKDYLAKQHNVKSNLMSYLQIKLFL
ncbi:glycosyltransferase family 2 protein [Vibrio sp. WJH972]